MPYNETLQLANYGLILLVKLYESFIPKFQHLCHTLQ